MLASDTPIVSIITLLSGRRKFLPLVRACVEAQTYPAEKIEWVIIDDGADDVGDFFSGSRELYLRSNKPLNIGRKRQFASDVASGEFLFFFDDDSIIHNVLSAVLKSHRKLKEWWQETVKCSRKQDH